MKEFYVDLGVLESWESLQFAGLVRPMVFRTYTKKTMLPAVFSLFYDV